MWHLRPILIPLGAIFSVLIYIDKSYGRVSDSHILYATFLMFLISFDSLLLHFKYFLVSRGVKYQIIDEDTAAIMVGDKQILLTKFDVLLVELHLPPSVYDGTFGWGNGENYSYMKIFDINGRSFIITNLLNKKLELPESFLPRVKKIRRWRCWPR